MGLYEMYVLATRTDTTLIRRRLARSLYAKAKLRNRKLKRQYLRNQKGSFESMVDRRAGQLRDLGGFRKHIFNIISNTKHINTRWWIVYF